MCTQGCTFSNNLVGTAEQDIYNPSCDGTVTFDSDCRINQYNAGSGVLGYYCNNMLPSDLSGTCSACPTGQYSCCGSLACSATQPTCTSNQVVLCPAPTMKPTVDPLGTATPTHFPTHTPREPSPMPTKDDGVRFVSTEAEFVAAVAGGGYSVTIELEADIALASAGIVVSEWAFFTINGDPSPTNQPN